MKKRNLATVLIILGVIILSVIILKKPVPETSEEIAKCIGQNADLYVQLGCHACTIQEKMFGENSQYLNIIDCWFEKDKCSGIAHTPTWIISKEKYIGVQNIEELKKLTGC